MQIYNNFGRSREHSNVSKYHLYAQMIPRA